MAEKKDTKIVDDSEDPEPRHGGDWFWTDPPDLTEPLAKSQPKEPTTKS